jgi:hypothetical protein
VNYKERIGQDDVEVLERCHGWQSCRAEKMRRVFLGRMPSRGTGDWTFSEDAPWSFVVTFVVTFVLCLLGSRLNIKALDAIRSHLRPELISAPTDVGGYPDGRSRGR